MAEIRIVKHEELEAVQKQIPDTSNFATKTEVNKKADSNHTHAYSDLSGTPTIPADMSAEVAALRAELDELKGIVEGMTGTPEE